jgi:hypothetical protein
MNPVSLECGDTGAEIFGASEVGLREQVSPVIRGRLWPVEPEFTNVRLSNDLCLEIIGSLQEFDRHLRIDFEAWKLLDMIRVLRTIMPILNDPLENDRADG